MESPHRNPNFTTDRPVAVLMVFLAAVVFGYFSLGQLPVTLMPEMSYPTLTVRTEYPGAAPEEVENDISRPIEEALGVVSGLNEISSISRAGVSDVILEFVWGTSMVDAIQNTLEKLDLVYLPREAEKPLLLHYDPSLDPVMELSLSGSSSSTKYHGDEGLRRLRRIAELQVKRLIEPIKGVAAARVRGGLEEEIHVLIDEGKLQRVNLSIGQVISRLRAENINAAGGRIREGGAEYMIRTINEYQTLEEIADTIGFRREGREIRVKDLGQVVHGQRDREMLTRTDGAESVQIDIYKEADANMVAVAKRVIALVGEVPDFGKKKEDKTKSPEELQREKMKNFFRGPTLAGKLFNEEQAKLRVVADRSVFIDNSIQEVLNTALLGGLLAVVVLLFFLRDIRTTAIIALSIPISILVTFAPLNLLNVSLNIMSLGGLAMGIGMLVDCSHSAYLTTMDAMELSASPVTFSHSNPKALCDHPRNITDDQIRGCAATGGVIGINGIGKFLGDSIDPENFVDHIAYTADLVGAQHVGVALDYSDGSDDLQDAITGQSNFWPPQWYSGTMEFMAPNRLIDAVDIMLRRNFSSEDITGILGGNFFALAQRVWL